jgi:hypothetical protein
MARPPGEGDPPCWSREKIQVLIILALAKGAGEH